MKLTFTSLPVVSCEAPQWYLTLMIMAYSNMADTTNMVHKPSQRSIREKLSEAADFSLASPDVLISIRSVVTKRPILPGTISGGIEKLHFVNDRC